MRVLGIDPGTAICGFGIVDINGSRLKAITYDAIETSPREANEIRLKKIYSGINDLIITYKPDVMAVELLFFNKNIKTAMAVGQARGVILLAAAQNDLPIVELTPLQVKQSVVGYGKATKEQVIYMTQKLLCLTEVPRVDDIADALAVAICGAHQRTSNMLKWR